jgi:uncharacterized protein (UPF0548 family)
MSSRDDLVDGEAQRRASLGESVIRREAEVSSCIYVILPDLWYLGTPCRSIRLHDGGMQGPDENF